MFVLGDLAIHVMARIFVYSKNKWLFLLFIKNNEEEIWKYWLWRRYVFSKKKYFVAILYIISVIYCSFKTHFLENPTHY